MFLINQNRRKQKHSELVAGCVVGIVMANIYSLLITNHGLLLSDIFPRLMFFEVGIPKTSATFLFAAILQMAIAILYFTFAVSRRTQKLGIFVFLMVIVVVSFYFGFLSVYSNSRGQHYKEALETRMEALMSKIDAESRYISDTVSRSIAGYRELVVASKRGDDKTGIASCGSLCRRYYDRIEHITENYAHLMQSTMVGARSQHGDAKTWTRLAASRAEYINRAAAFKEFLKEERVPIKYGLSRDIEDEFTYLSGIMNKGLSDELSLTLLSLSEARMDVRVLISALISILPDIINISLAVALSILLTLRRRERNVGDEQSPVGTANAEESEGREKGMVGSAILPAVVNG